MEVTPEELLSASEHFLQYTRTEAEIRATVSRIYYSAFHKCRIIAGMPEDLPGGRMHAQVIRKYNNSVHQEHIDVANILSGLRRNRIHADYHLKTPLPTETATDDLARVKKLFAHLDQLTHPVP